VFVEKMVFGFGGKKKEKNKPASARPTSVAESVNPEVIPLAPSEIPVIPAIQPKTESKPNSVKLNKKPMSKPISKPNSAISAKPKSKSVVVKKTNNESPEKVRQSMPDKLKPLNIPKSKPTKKRSANLAEKCANDKKKHVYMPPSKLLKHLDPDAKKKKNTNNQALSTNVNRLLKQNTQDLFGNLTLEVRKAFETLFDRIDVTDSGGITAKEIQQLIKKHTNKNLTLQQVQNVLRDLDVKGTGDIEFDEFIFMLSQPSNYVRLFDKHELKGLANKETQNLLEKNQRQDENDTTFVFFEALRNATKQDSMTALRTFYKNRLKKLNDHVIHDWSAGQRCIGLSDQEMLKRYETIQGELLRQRVNFCKDNSYKTSPYARPLEWGVMNLREAIIARRKLAQEINTIKPDPRRVKMSEFVVTPKAVPLPRYVIKKRSPLKRTFNYDQLASIRDKVDNIAKTYYDELKHVAGENSTVVQKELAVDEIKSKTSQANFMHTFEAYCAPFVVSPWIPMPNPTLQASYSPLGRSKLGAMRPVNTVIHGKRGFTTGDTLY